MPSTDTRERFEAWLRSECFHAPPEHARDLAWAAWQAALRSPVERGEGAVAAGLFDNARELREVADVLNLCIDALEGRDGADVCTELAAAGHRIDMVIEAVALELAPAPNEPEPPPVPVEGGQELDSVGGAEVHPASATAVTNDAGSASAPPVPVDGAEGRLVARITYDLDRKETTVDYAPGFGPPRCEGAPPAPVEPSGRRHTCRVCHREVTEEDGSWPVYEDGEARPDLIGSVGPEGFVCYECVEAPVPVEGERERWEQWCDEVSEKFGLGKIGSGSPDREFWRGYEAAIEDVRNHAALVAASEPVKHVEQVGESTDRAAWLAEYERRKLALAEAVWALACGGGPYSERHAARERAEAALDAHVNTLAVLPVQGEPPAAVAAPESIDECGGSIPPSFGAALREARVAAGLSLRDVALMLGTTTVRLGEVERGRDTRLRYTTPTPEEP